QDLNLTIASSHFGVHGREDHADFTDEIGIHFRRSLESVWPSLIVHADAVALNIDIACAYAGEACLLRPKDFVVRLKDTAHRADQIEHVVAHEWQVGDLLFRQNVAYRRGRYRNEVLRLDGYFNGLRGRSHLQCEVQPELSCVAELNGIECLRLKSGKRRA